MALQLDEDVIFQAYYFAIKALMKMSVEEGVRLHLDDASNMAEHVATYIATWGAVAARDGALFEKMNAESRHNRCYAEYLETAKARGGVPLRGKQRDAMMGVCNVTEELIRASQMETLGSSGVGDA